MVEILNGRKQQITFEEIKHRLMKLSVLHLPDSKGRFHSYSDTNKFATGSDLYQIQNGKPKTNSVCKYNITRGR